MKSWRESRTGDGGIVGARYVKPSGVLDIRREEREYCLFDPQFYLPNTKVGELKEYPFFPDVFADGFVTAEWDAETAYSCAVSCLRFQNERGFRGLVIPGRVYGGIKSDFIESQEGQFVEPFLRALTDLGYDGKQVYLQVVVTEHMIKNEVVRRELLNWVTSHQRVKGIYLVYYLESRSKQIEDIEFLVGLMSFIENLKYCGMDVCVGYCNTESLLLMCAGADAVSMGSYENLRMFGLDAFEKRDKDKKMKGPNPRVYVSRLLQWVEHQYLGAIELAV
jgi:hypothetical protein